MRRFFFQYFFTAALLAACSETPEPASMTPVEREPFARPAADQISETEAAARKAKVSNITYTIDIDLVTEESAYQGTVDIQFDLSDSSVALDIDFTGGDISTVIANGDTINVDYNGYYLLLPSDALLSGQNTVSIEYSHPFDQDGTGLHRFVDPEDGNTYLYTYLWPYYSNRLFPNFDQPDLKGRYELTVLAESDWQVVSAMTEDRVENLGDTARWHFPLSEKFSSYIFSLHAGPYTVWEDQAGDIPIRLMARQSLADYVAVEEWLGYTKAGLSHFNDYFDIPYPFVKYDQVIVPDFLIGAMENVAAVTFSESYIDRGVSNRFNSQRRAGTILHEMAHMWFGDLVTMRWWNGLWLNESFATLMSSIATYESTEFKDLWHDFYLSENLTAISADNAVSTHPIEVPVRSSNDFFNVFDSITYDKGASVLNQLSHYIGRENFRLGVSNYLKTHSWGNTDLADFMRALSEQAGTDLAPWAEDWMYNAGVNSLSARFTCEANLIDSFAILQTMPSNYPTLRDQRIQLGLFDKAETPLNLFATIEVQVSGAETQVAEALGLPCPALALPNYEAWGYAEIILDEQSMATLSETDALLTTEDPLLRSMLWTSLFDAPNNDQLESATVLTMAIDSMAAEKNDRIVRQTLSAVISQLDQLERMESPSLIELGERAENALWEQIAIGTAEQSESTLNLRLTQYIAMSRSDAALNRLVRLLNNDITVPGLSTGQGMRWRLIQRLTARNHPQARDLLASEITLDASDSGRRAAIAAEAALPDAEIKERWLREIRSIDQPLPLSHLRAAMGAIFPVGQESFQEDLLGAMLQGLTSLASTKDNYFLQSYGRDLFNGLCSESSLNSLSSAIENREAIGPTLYRFMSENVQSAELCAAGKDN